MGSATKTSAMLRSLVIVSLILVAGIVTFPRLKFTAAMLLLSTQADIDDMETERMRDLLDRYPRLLPVIKQHDNFGQIIAEQVIRALKDNQDRVAVELSQPLQLELLRLFPDNLFLQALDVYPDDHAPGELANLDALSLLILAEAELNHLTFPILTQSDSGSQVPESFALLVVLYTNWQKNFALSEQLRSWYRQTQKISIGQDQILGEDLLRRKQNQPDVLDQKRRPAKEVMTSLALNLAMDPENHRLGENLIPGKPFLSSAEGASHWFFSDMSDGENFSKGSFFGDLDNDSLRILCFFTQKTEGRQVARGGFWHKHSIPLEKCLYIFGFRYRTLLDTESPTFWLDYQFKKEWKLEPTANQWKHAVFLFDNSAWGIKKIQPLLRIFGPGSAWFDDIWLYKWPRKEAGIDKEVLFIQ
jgi:hypothetical protein